jgi:hypothetical protein
MARSPWSVGFVRTRHTHPSNSHDRVLPAVDFFNHLNMLYGTVTEFCTPQEVRLPVLSTLILSLNLENGAFRSARSCPRDLGESARA